MCCCSEPGQFGDDAVAVAWAAAVVVVWAADAVTVVLPAAAVDGVWPAAAAVECAVVTAYLGVDTGPGSAVAPVHVAV